MRALLVTHAPNRFTFGNAYVSAILSTGEFTKHEVDTSWSIQQPESYDAIVYFVKFRELRELSAINWGSFSGPRALLDLDAFHDYGGWWGSRYIGEWTSHARRLGFNLLITSGRTSTSHFAKAGFDSAFLPKGYASQEFYDLKLRRSGIGHYGTAYRARAAMLRDVRGAGIKVDDFRVPHAELNARLNEYLSILVCNMTSEARFGWVGRAIEHRRPGTVLRLGPAPEPMIKNFEAAAAGCAVFMDETPELKELGFIDGETAIIYRDFTELIEKLDFWGPQEDGLRRIGSASAALCRDRHTWEHRARQMQEILNARLSSQPDPREPPAHEPLREQRTTPS